MRDRILKDRMYKELKNYGIAFAIGLVLYVLYITGHGVPCPVYAVTGFKCSGCGATRMFYYILKLDFNTAFRQNQCFFILLPFIVTYFVYQSIRYIKCGERLHSRVINAIAGVVAVFVVLFGIIRNFV